jgi:transcription elongation GreA/GreB family factor
MNKKKIIRDILVYLEQELSAIINAANNAHLAATDDQSVAETQYDTLAIEASYLAEGQSRRVTDIQQAKHEVEQLVIRKFHENSPITLGALVKIMNEDNVKQWYFIAPAAGGFCGMLNEQSYTVVTPSSPMAKALIGKFINDEVELMIGVNKRLNEIIGIY